MLKFNCVNSKNKILNYTVFSCAMERLKVWKNLNKLIVSGQQKDVLKPSKMRCKIKASKF